MPYLMTHKGKLFDVEDAFEILLDYNAIFIGEEHDSRISHDAELTILKGLAERDSSLVIALDVLGEDRIYLPKLLHLDSKKYYKLFMTTMEQVPYSEPMVRLNPKGLYKAQVLKDAVMAASIEPFLDQHILFCCGHFHSDYHLGIPYQLRKNHPGLKMTVITMAAAVEDLPMKDRARIGDFIWI